MQDHPGDRDDLDEQDRRVDRDLMPAEVHVRLQCAIDGDGPFSPKPTATEWLSCRSSPFLVRIGGRGTVLLDWIATALFPSEKGAGMLAKLKTFSLLGIDALPVEVEVDVSPAGLPKTVLVGLPEAAVKESTHRVERAIVNSGFQRPQNRVVINLAPADLPKEAASFDLPIALGILAGSGQIAAERLEPIRRGGRTGPRRHHPAHQGRAVDGHGRRRAGRASRAARAQPAARPRRPWSKASRSFPSPAWPRPSAF